MAGGALVSNAVPLEHGALLQAHPSQRREGEQVGDKFDARALPAQIEAEMERLVVYADAQERKVTELQTALDTRAVIEQAIGILSERFVLPVPDAFEVLRAAARNSRQEVRVVAEELRGSRETPLAISEVLVPGADSVPGSVVDLHKEALRCPRCGTLVNH